MTLAEKNYNHFFCHSVAQRRNLLFHCGNGGAPGKADPFPFGFAQGTG